MIIFTIEFPLCSCGQDPRPLKNAQFWSRSRKVRILTTGISRIFRGLKSEPDAKIGQISANFERERFAKVSIPFKGSVHKGFYLNESIAKVNQAKLSP
jgi:hypothetical protein